MNFEQERSLVGPVIRYISYRGFTKYEDELQFYECSIDLYGFSRKSGLSIAVELKLTRWKKALKQALRYQLCADLVYVAVPKETAMRVDVSQFEAVGIGIIDVGLNRCRERLAPIRSSVVRPHYRDFYIDYLTCR